MRRLARVAEAAMMVAFVVFTVAFTYATLVWLSEPYECVNCDPE